MNQLILQATVMLFYVQEKNVTNELTRQTIYYHQMYKPVIESKKKENLTNIE
jgi:hypothetical protein